MNAKDAHKASCARKLPKGLTPRFNKQYDKILTDYIKEIDFYIMLYSSWGIFWCPLPVHLEPAIFNDAREHFEKLGFEWKNCMRGEDKYDEWHLQWFEALLPKKA